MKNYLSLLSIVLILLSCSQARISVSDKQFPPTSLVNHYEYFEGKHKFDQLGTAFLLKYREDTFAITTKHTLAILKTDSIKNLSLENFIKSWTMSALTRENEMVVTDKLLNEDKSESLKSKEALKKDWLVFSIKENNANVIPVEFREKPLVKGEKLYVVGWTRHMKEGDQRVYEFKYYKTKGTHHLLKKIIVPEKFGGLSGAPVLDEEGKLIGMVSTSKFDLLAMKKLFAPVGTEDLRVFLDAYLSDDSNR